MTATLREAAQALARDWMLKGTFPPLNPDDTEEVAERAVYARCARLLADVLAAAPPETGWAEGAEAMRAACREAASTAIRVWATLPGIKVQEIVDGALAALPPPSAPTQAPDPWPEHRAVVGSGKVGPDGRLQPDEDAKPCPCGAPAYQWHRSTPLCTHMQTTAPAPEAKTAESEVGWIVRLKREPGRLSEWAVWDSLRTAERQRLGRMRDPSDYVIQKVTITAEPAPVEPEETRR